MAELIEQQQPVGSEIDSTDVRLHYVLKHTFPRPDYAIVSTDVWHQLVLYWDGTRYLLFDLTVGEWGAILEVRNYITGIGRWQTGTLPGKWAPTFDGNRPDDVFGRRMMQKLPSLHGRSDNVLTVAFRGGWLNGRCPATIPLFQNWRIRNETLLSSRCCLSMRSVF